MMQNSCKNDYVLLLQGIPHAVARIKGDDNHPGLHGTVKFYNTKQGVLIAAEIRCLPKTEAGFYGFHIHEGNACAGNEQDPFEKALSHFNPENTAHPSHAGDLPPLVSAGGYAFSVFLTNRFSLCEILGRTIIIHSHADDFASQPAGNAGTKIACGVICPI